jgi:NADH-quinone oxidoreductase subunit N
MIASLSFVLPELLLTAVAVVLLLVDDGRRERKGLTLSLAGGALLGAGGLAWASPDGVAFNMLTLDATGRLLKVLLAGAVLMVLAFSSSFSGFAGSKEKPFHWGTFAGLLLLSTVGLFFLVSASDFLVILIAIELISVSSFVLTGFLREDRRASEAAIKYFMVGAFSAGLMVFGMSLLYGITGGTSLSALTGEGASTLPALPWPALFSLSWRGLGSSWLWSPFTCGPPTCMRGLRRRSQRFCRWRPKPRRSA